MKLFNLAVAIMFIFVAMAFGHGQPIHIAEEGTSKIEGDTSYSADLRGKADEYWHGHRVHIGGGRYDHAFWTKCGYWQVSKDPDLKDDCLPAYFKRNGQKYGMTGEHTHQIRGGTATHNHQDFQGHDAIGQIGPNMPLRAGNYHYEESDLVCDDGYEKRGRTCVEQVSNEEVSSTTTIQFSNQQQSSQQQFSQHQVSNEEDSSEGFVHYIFSTVDGSSDVPEDVDEDGDVDNDDLLEMSMKFGSTDPDDLARYDLDNDGDIDTDDFTIVQSRLGSTVNGAPAPSLALHLERIKGLDTVHSDHPHVIQRLERRLLEPLPDKTVLLANFPNPFNPETWIPYRLAEAADVTVTIYATNGQPVRTLTLGHQHAGVYVERGRAAYWDGRNAYGEPVGSGLYFYTLTAGDFSATRKMLIAK